MLKLNINGNRKSKNINNVKKKSILQLNFSSLHTQKKDYNKSKPILIINNFKRENTIKKKRKFHEIAQPTNEPKKKRKKNVQRIQASHINQFIDNSNDNDISFNWNFDDIITNQNDKIDDLVNQFFKDKISSQRILEYINEITKFAVILKISDNHIIFPEYQDGLKVGKLYKYVNFLNINGQVSCECKYFRNFQVCEHSCIYFLKEKNKLNEINYIAANTDNNFINGDNNVIFIRQIPYGNIFSVYSVNIDNNRWSIVYINRSNKIMCNRHKNTKFCVCRVLLKSKLKDEGDWFESFGDLQDEKEVESNFADIFDWNAFNSTSISKKKIPLPKYLLYNKNELTEYHNYIKPTNINTDLYPETNVCECGYNFINKNENIKNEFDGTLYSLENTIQVKTYEICCPMCQRIYHYDGNHDHILNWNNHYLFTHCLLNHYTSNLSNYMITFIAFITTIKNLYQENGSKKFISQSFFEKIYFLFLDLQEWDNELLWCILCDKKLENIIEGVSMDGTSLRFQKRYLNKNRITPTTTNKTNEQNNQFLINTDTSTTFYLSEDLTNYGTKYLTTKFRRLKTDKINEPLSEEEMKEFNRLLRIKSFHLYDFMKYVDTSNNDLVYDNSMYFFLRSLFKKISIFEIVKIKIINICKSIIQHKYRFQTSEVQQTLSTYSPLLFNIIQRSHEMKITLPDCFYYLISELALFSESTYKKKEILRNKYPALSLCDEDTKQKFMNYQESGSIYGLPPVRMRGNYANDNDTKQSESSDCNKCYDKSNGKTAAVYVLRCIRHNIPLGAHIIEDAESVNDSFSTIICMFQKAPKLILQDNSCKFHPYSMNREPVFFKDSIIANDECHSKGHLCFPSYSIKFYKNSSSEFRNMNDSGIESGNSFLKLINKSARYMKQETFMKILRLILLIDRRRLLRKIYEYN